MSFSIESYGARCVCERCGYSWWTFYKKEPKACAKCKNKGWNKPRTYSGKYVSATICKREKATEKKAKTEKDSIATSAGESSN